MPISLPMATVFVKCQNRSLIIYWCWQHREKHSHISLLLILCCFSQSFAFYLRISKMLTMFDKIYSTVHLLQFIPCCHHYYFTSQLHDFYNKICWIPFSVFYIWKVIGSSSGSWVTSQDPHCYKKMGLSSSIIPLIGLWLWVPGFSMLGIWLISSCEFLMQTVIDFSANNCNYLSCPRNKFYWTCSLFLVLTIILSNLL